MSFVIVTLLFPPKLTKPHTCMDHVTISQMNIYLEIKMSHIMVVEMLNTEEDLFDEVGRLLLRQPLPVSYEVKQLSTSQAKIKYLDSKL